MTIELKSARFRQEREASWKELEELLKRVERGGPRRLSAAELTSLPQLYRAALSSLSVARSISLDKNVISYLEALTNRAYFQVYSNKQGMLASIFHFVVYGFPQAFRRYWRHIALAGAFLALGTIVGMVLTVSEPQNYYMFVDPELAGDRGPDSTKEQLLEVLYNKDEGEASVGALSGFSGFLFINNFYVAVMCFVVGIIPAIPVIYLMFSNGLMLGAFAGIHYTLGISKDLWGWLLPHGITELFAVVVCGGAGLAMGQSLVFPGRHTRLQNLGRIGREVSIFAAAAGVMLVYAALVEGYFRQLVNSVPVRYSLAAVSLIFWIVYLGWAGRVRTQPAGATSNG